MKTTIPFLAIMILMSQCATILNSQNQKETINTSRQNKILIYGRASKRKDGKFLVKRDFGAKQITARREGYKDESITIFQHKKSPIHILSIVPFGVLLYPMLFDKGPKSFDYGSEITIGNQMAPYQINVTIQGMLG